MKRFIALALALLLIAAAGCQAQTQQTPAPQAQDPAPTQSDPAPETEPAPETQDTNPIQSDPAPETEPAPETQDTNPIQSDPAPETEPPSEAREPDLPALAAQLLDCGAFSYEMEEYDKAIGCSFYGLEEDAAEEMYFYFPPGPTADELVLFKAKDEAGAETLAKAVEGRIEYQRHAFESYGPEEVKKLDASYLLRKGVYVLFLAADDPSRADELLKPYF